MMEDTLKMITELLGGNPQETVPISTDIADLQVRGILPLDLRNLYCAQLEIFGEEKPHPYIGQYAVFSGGDVVQVNGAKLDAGHNLLGKIVRCEHECIVLEFTGVYIGWIYPEDFRLVNFKIETTPYLQ